MATGGSDPFSSRNEADLLRHIFSPKIVDGPSGGYVVKLPVVGKTSTIRDKFESFLTIVARILLVGVTFE